MRKRNYILIAVLLSFAVQMPAILWAGDERDNQKRKELTGIGLTFDKALVQDAIARTATLADVRTRLDALLDDNLPKDSRAAARLLSGDIYIKLGQAERAVAEYKEAVDGANNGPYRDDSRFALIEALEMAGRHTEADEQRNKWLEDYSDSPLAGEVRISHLWSLLRRDSLELASQLVKTITREHPWLKADERVTLARDMVSFAQERYEDVTAEPGGGELDAAILYLRGLTEIARGKSMDAAARFQQLIRKYPESDLCERAMLAKANIFLTGKAYASAAEEFGRVAETVTDPAIIAEAHLRRAASIYLSGDIDAGVDALREVTVAHDGTAVAARAQMMLGEALVDAERYEDAILEFNTVLTKYFQHELAAGAQYRVGRCFTALQRDTEATGAYQAVVAGYPTSREAPAAAYLAGVGLLKQDRPRPAAPYFQIVLDRYAQDPGDGRLEFATPDRRELVEASLCLLQLSYHRAGDLGMLSGVPHEMVLRMPQSTSTWRAFALLIDADALASQGRYDEARASLESLEATFPQHPATPPALQLLAWIYAQQGDTEMAIATQNRLLERHRDSGSEVDMAVLNRAHILFNEKKYDAAAKEYESYLARASENDQRLVALYQAGICYLRLNRDGDAVDRFDKMTAEAPGEEITEKAWLRAGDVYFRAGHYDEARRCYKGLLENFAGASSSALGMLRVAQCDYNAGDDAAAIAAFSNVIETYPTHRLAAEARRGIEQALYRLGQSGEGEDALADLIEQFPSSSFAADAQFEIGARRYDEKDWSGAAEAFRRVVTQFPGYSSADRAQYLLADALRRAGDVEASDGAYEQFLAFFPGSPLASEVRVQVGAAQFARGEYMPAAIEFTAILADSTSREVRAAALYNLALCQRMLEDNAAALKSLEEYESKYPRDDRAAEIAHQLAELYDLAGRTADAEKHYLGALEAGAKEHLKAELYYRLGVCRETLEDIDGAMRAYSGARRQRERDNPFRLTALARMAAVYESRGEVDKAVKTYKDLIKNATAENVRVAARARVSELAPDEVNR